MRTPFFITGSGRSGSTYLFHLLHAHPKVAITNEARILDALWRAYQVVAVPYGQVVPEHAIAGVVPAEISPQLGEVFASHLLEVVEEFYERHFGPGFTHFGDKLPDYTVLAMAARAHPEIRTIMMVRDPRDVVCSYRVMQKRVVGNGAREVNLRELGVRELAVIWRDTYEVLLRAVPDAHRVDYVDLVTRPAETVTAVLDYLGLEYHSAISQEIASNDTIRTHGSSATPAASIGRWRRDLSPADVNLISEICAPMMAELGLPV